MGGISTRISSATIEKILITVILVITGLIMIFHLATLVKFPIVFVDEPWFSNAAWNWLKTGNNTDTISAPSQLKVIWPYLGNLPLRLSFAMLGLGLFQARLTSWLFGGILLLLTLFVGRKCYSLLTGSIAALLLSLSSPFAQASHYARPDIMLAAFIMAAFLLMLNAFEKEQWWSHMAAGLLLGIGQDIHQNAMFFAAGLGILYIYNYRFSILRRRGFWLFIAGCALGIIYYIAFTVAPHWADFQNYYRFSLETSHRMPLLTGDLLYLVKSIIAERSVDIIFLKTAWISCLLAQDRHTWWLVDRSTIAEFLFLSFLRLSCLSCLLGTSTMYMQYSCIHSS